MTDNVPSKSLVDRVAAWLDEQGYPTEFRAADLFRRHGFHAQQGHYIESKDRDKKREIDVIADETFGTNFGFFRLSYLVECKWSLKKP